MNSGLSSMDRIKPFLQCQLLQIVSAGIPFKFLFLPLPRRPFQPNSPQSTLKFSKTKQSSFFLLLVLLKFTLFASAGTALSNSFSKALAFLGLPFPLRNNYHFTFSLRFLNILFLQFSALPLSPPFPLWHRLAATGLTLLNSLTRLLGLRLNCEVSS